MLSWDDRILSINNKSIQVLLSFVMKCTIKSSMFQFFYQNILQVKWFLIIIFCYWLFFQSMLKLTCPWQCMGSLLVIINMACLLLSGWQFYHYEDGILHTQEVGPNFFNMQSVHLNVSPRNAFKSSLSLS